MSNKESSTVKKKAEILLHFMIIPPPDCQMVEAGQFIIRLSVNPAPIFKAIIDAQRSLDRHWWSISTPEDFYHHERSNTRKADKCRSRRSNHPQSHNSPLTEYAVMGER